MSRAQTVILALLLMCALMGGLSAVVANRGRYSKALQWWAWGTLMFGFGLFITLLPIAEPTKHLSLFVGNSLIAWAPVWAARGALVYCPRQLSPKWVNALLLLTLIVLALNALVWQLPVINLIAPTPIAIVLFVIGGYFLATHPVADAANASRFLAIAMLVSALDWILRTAFVLGVLGASPERERADLIIALFAIAQILLLVASTMAIFWMEVRRMEASLLHLALVDPLTGLANRRATMQRFDEEKAKAKRQGLLLAMMVIDLDHFKRINDQFGHHVGDVILQAAAKTLTEAKRAEDFLGRIGGEEFILLFVVNTPHAAFDVADRLRQTLFETPFRVNDIEHRLTFSGGIGLTSFDGDTWDKLFTAADQRAYVSKQAGRNRVSDVTHETPAAIDTSPRYAI